MTDGSFPPPPGFQPPSAAPPVSPGGYVPAPPMPGAPPPGYPPPPPKKSRAGCWIGGCGGGCLLLIVLLIVGVFAIGPITTWLGASAFSWITSGEVVWHAASPDGAREAQLRRFGIGQAQLAYSLTVTAANGQGDRCTAAFMVGPRVEDYTQIQWLTPTSLSVRYGQPTGAAAFQAPTTNTGTGACSGITVTATHDPSLDAAADAAFANGPSSASGDAGKDNGGTPSPPPADGGDQDTGGGGK